MTIDYTYATMAVPIVSKQTTASPDHSHHDTTLIEAESATIAALPQHIQPDTPRFTSQ